jgi:two-component system CitB family sensor kinase
MRQRPDETWQIGVAMWRTRPLATQILLCVLAILLVTSTAGAVLYANLTDKTLDGQYEQRALDIANTVAQIPAIADALERKDPDHRIQALAEQVRGNTSASYVVVADRNGVRYSHPTPSLIGKRLEEPVVALDGSAYTGIDPGSLGNSANAKVPLRAPDGAIIGEVSVGIPEERVSSQITVQILDIVLYSLLALGIGVLASWLLARALKRVTFGLELSEIAALLQEREAMLHGIREGVVGIDARGCVSVINDEARRLLGIRRAGTGRPVSELLPAGRLRDLLADGPLGSDEVVLTDEFLLVVNRMPVMLAGRPAGHVVTLRDRTELEGLMRELHALTGLTNALRAQEHEFTNRLHVLSGLLGLGETDEAARYLAEVAGGAAAQANDIQVRIAPAELAALLVAKVTTAAESGVRLIIDPESRLDRGYAETGPLLTVLGNLIDNAVDAVAGGSEPREVTVRITDVDDAVRVLVGDTGPGIPSTEVEKIFLDGYSTKSTRNGIRRGLGLALVSRLVLRAGGSIEVAPGPGARFDVRLPLRTPDLEVAR